MFCLLSVLCVLSLSCYVKCMPNRVIPEGYNLLVQPTCGASLSEDTTILITTDLDLVAIGLCKNKAAETFTTSNGIQHTLTVKTFGSSTDCLFFQKNNSNVYSITIEISFGTPGTLIEEEMLYIITCTYDKNHVNVEEGVQREIGEPYLQPIEVQQNMGQGSPATLSLDVIDVLGNPITAGSSVPLGRYIGLRGRAVGADGVGLRVTSCLAIGGAERFAVLRGGCGDGLIFKKTKGFITSGLRTQSPWFKAFSLDGSTVVQFLCNFTLCPTNCDGSSCTNRARRNTEIEIPEESFYPSVELVSKPLQIGSRTCHTIHQKDYPAQGLIMVARPEDFTRTQGHQNINYYITFWVLLGVVGTLVILSASSAVCLCLRHERIAMQAQLRDIRPLNIKF